MIVLLTSWLSALKNADHVGVTTQIYDAVKKAELSNDAYKAQVKELAKAIEGEDEAYKKTQKDWAVERLKAVDTEMDSYMVAIRSIVAGHAALPEAEEHKQPALEILHLWKDYAFKLSDSYSAESSKVINMYQEVAKQQAAAEKLGIWTYFGKAKEKAEEVQRLLAERFTDMASRTAGELKEARSATDQAIKQLYQVINSMQVLLPGEELTELSKVLRSIEDYARIYYLKTGASSGENRPDDGTGLPDIGGEGDDDDNQAPPFGGD